MILNTGGRTDTVQYFTPWLLKRFEEGYVLSRNPMFPNKVTRYDLTPEKVDCVVFCSKNYKPILKDIGKIVDKFNTYFHYTITAYGKDIEPGVPSIEESIQTLKELSEIVGKKRLAWRYDPVLLTEKYTIQRHLETFAEMAKEISPYVDRCIFSFVEMYKKLQTNMPELIPMTEEDKKELAKGMAKIADRYELYLQSCAAKDEYVEYGVHASGCMTAEILGEANGVKFKKVKHSGNRAGCQCMESRGIGDYDTCLNGCKYCYANTNPRKAFENYKFHDPDSPLLLGHLKETDIVQQGVQRSMLEKMEEGEQLEFKF